jgi:hypothetical protein
MSSTQCKDTKSYEHVNEHTTGRNILTENYHTQQENADSIKLQINLVSDIPLGFISLLNGISAHTFLIEKGSYFRPKFCRNLRLCSLCNKIEDEEHFLLFCKKPPAFITAQSFLLSL